MNEPTNGDLMAAIFNLHDATALSINRLDGKIDALGKRLDGRINALGDRLGGRIDGVNGKIDQLRTEMNGRFDIVDVRLERLEKATFDHPPA